MLLPPLPNLLKCVTSLSCINLYCTTIIVQLPSKFGYEQHSLNAHLMACCLHCTVYYCDVFIKQPVAKGSTDGPGEEPTIQAYYQLPKANSFLMMSCIGSQSL